MNKLMRRLRRDRKGFTLAELLIVVAIIAVLVAIAIPTFSGALDKANKATDDANIRAAYAEHQVHEMDSSLSEDASITTIGGKLTITFADTSTYVLKYYTAVDVSGTGPWRGTSPST